MGIFGLLIPQFYSYWGNLDSDRNQVETNFSPKILELVELNFLKVRSSVFPTLAMPECFPSYSQEDPSFQEG